MHSNQSTYRSHQTAARAAVTSASPTVRRALLTAARRASCARLRARHSRTRKPSEPSNPNNYECSGNLSAGKAEAGGEETPVQYTFLCDGQITGYQVQTQLPITGIEGCSDL